MALDPPIRFRSADEFRSRSAWRDRVDPAKHRLKRIIGDYSFSRENELPCGLLGCRTPHQNGYVVETEDGLETHIGNHCGRRYFGVNWGEIQSVYNHATEEQNRQEFLDSTLRKRDDLLRRIDDISGQLSKATDAVREVLERFNREPMLIMAVERLVRDRGAIQVEREIDADMAGAMNLRERDRRYMETIARVAGTEVIFPANKLHPKGEQHRSSLLNAEATLRGLSATSLRDLTPRQQKERVKAVELVESTIVEAQNHLHVSRQFLNPSNLRSLAKLQVKRPNSRTERILHHFAQIGSDT